MSLLSRLFGARRAPAPEPALPRDRNPVAVAAILDRQDKTGVGAEALGDARTQADYEAFCAGFCHQPGVRFIEFLKEDGVDRMLEWLDPANPEPEPKAFIRLMVRLMERGESIWDAPGLSMYLDGRWSAGGGPSEFSSQALSVLSQILGKPIKLYYREKPGDQAPLMLKHFQS